MEINCVSRTSTPAFPSTAHRGLSVRSIIYFCFCEQYRAQQDYSYTLSLDFSYESLQRSLVFEMLGNDQ